MIEGSDSEQAWLMGWKQSGRSPIFLHPSSTALNSSQEALVWQPSAGFKAWFVLSPSWNST